MALTLVEAAKLNSGDVIRSSIIEMFARQSDILQVLPFENISGNALKYNREEALPGIGFRGVNEAFSESTGVLNPIVESLTIAGGDLDVDRFIVQTQGSAQRSTHEALKVKSLADTWTTKFIKGSNGDEPREFDGLQVRLTGTQLMAAGSTANGDALSLLKLDELIDRTDNPTHLLMSKSMRRRLTQAARNTAVGGFITYGVDAFGRQITKYNDIPILVAYSGNGGTEPIAFDEANPGGGTATGTSIYALSMGSGRLVGIQNGTMDVRDLGELDEKPVWRTRVEWYSAIAMYHGRAAARLWGISDAAVVA
jgi:hypothetical protein